MLCTQVVLFSQDHAPQTMSDIFISYASEDRQRAEMIAVKLGARGWSVWWDRNIPAGKKFPDVIEDEIQKARCVVVLWSQLSIKKDWVLEEAAEGRDRGVLIPILLDRVPLPRGFRLIQTADLTKWQGDATDIVFSKICDDVSALLANDIATVPTGHEGGAAVNIIERVGPGLTCGESSPQSHAEDPQISVARPEPIERKDELKRSQWFRLHRMTIASISAVGIALAIIIIFVVRVIAHYKEQPKTISSTDLPPPPADSGKPPQSLNGIGKGKLRLHFIDAGQAEAALLISPGGQVVAFDGGEDAQAKNCDSVLSYYKQLGVKRLDFLFVSHYHKDHIGCIPSILADHAAGMVVDRGPDYPSKLYSDYESMTATVIHRAQARVGDQWFLDSNSPDPVFLKVIAVNANGLSTTNENALSLSIAVTYGKFHAELGGDMTGDEINNVESLVASKVGELDVYKVHHHCSTDSTNVAWLTATRPTVAVISVGNHNIYKQPAGDCLQRLHEFGVKTYWTETGNGALPEAGLDVVGGNIVVEVAPGGATYTVHHKDVEESYWAKSIPAARSPPVTTNSYQKFAWSSNASIYHLATCDFVSNISPKNLQRGDTPPKGKMFHKDCPFHGQ
jgi:beta-lactamase superfamily II metal-dependent hydrolase